MASNQTLETLVATFNDYRTAEQAASELTDNGFSRDAIEIHSESKTAGAGYGGTERANEDHEGGIVGWWHRLIGSDEDGDAGNYEEAVRSGRTVLSLSVPDRDVDRAADILNRYGASEVDTRGQSGAGQARGTAEGGSVPVIEEELHVGKRVVRKGGVRVYSRVVNEPVEEQIRLREERVRVERRPADRAIDEHEVAQFRDQTIEVTEMSEEPVVGKRARVKEEVVVTKEATERTETVRGNVRHTEVNVEQLGNDAQSSDSDPSYLYGSQIARDPRYSGRSWDEVKDDVRIDYQRNNPTSRWDEVKNSIRNGWDKATGQR